MNYSSTDCLDTELTYSSTNKFRPLIKHNHCLSLNGTSDYINFGKDFIYKALSKDTSTLGSISFMYKSNLPNTSTAISYICDSVIGVNNDVFPTVYPFRVSFVGNKLRISCYGKSIACCDGTNDIISDGEWHTFYIHVNKKNGNHTNVTGYLDGKPLSFTSSSDSTTTAIFASIGVKTGNKTSKALSNYLNGSICNFKIYNTKLTDTEIQQCNDYIGNKLVHWYPMAEGSNNIINDAVGFVHGRLVSSSISNSWSSFQDVFAYNNNNGFKICIQPNDKSYLAKIPNIKSETCIYKSNFVNTIDGSGVYGTSYGTILSYTNDATLKVNINRKSTQNSYSQSMFQVGGINNAILLNKQTKFSCKLSFKLNSRTLTLPNSTVLNNPLPYIISVNIGSWETANQVSNELQINTLIDAISFNKWYTISTPIKTSSGIADTSNIGVQLNFYGYNNDKTAKSGYSDIFEVEVKDVEIYRHNDFELHEKLINGYNMSESEFDFSQNVENVAELKENNVYDFSNELLKDPKHSDDIYSEHILDKNYNLLGKRNLKLYKKSQSNKNLLRLEHSKQRNIFTNDEHKPHIITNGLACWLDGTNNSKFGHFRDVKKWKDLRGSNDISFGYTNFDNTYYWTNNCFVNENDNNLFNVNTALLNSKNSPFSTMSTFTCEIIFECNVDGTTDGREIFSMGTLDGVSPYYNVGVKLQEEKRLVFVSNDTSTISTKFIGTIELNTKYHLTLVRDSSNTRAYLNNAVIEASKKLNTNTNMYITNTNGQCNTLSLFGRNVDNKFSGRIYSFRFYDKALTDAELTTNYNIDKEKFEL